MFTRQKVLLAMLKAAGRPVQRIELTKWSFLLRHETSSGGGSAYFDFVPYHYGPFSFGLYQEAGKLESLGFIATDQDSWMTGNVVAPPLEDSQIKSDVLAIIQKFGGLEVESLMDYVYPKYPAFTTHSKRKQLAKKKVAPLAVYTCGYEGLSVDGFLNLLLASGIQQLIDVRMNPIARRYGFHKSTLAKLCNNLGIEYVHIPELGIRSELRQELGDQSDYERLFKLYRKTTLADEVVSIDLVAGLVKQKPSVLVCMEHLACCCHRSHLADAVAKKTGLSVMHLGQVDDAV